MIEKFDQLIIKNLRKYSILISKVSIFIIYFYFGILKVLGTSPANTLVEELLSKTLFFIPFSLFIILWGLFEMLIGILFVIRGMERLAIFLLLIHMIIVALPLILLPKITWQRFLVATLEGQYIIKNLVIISLALVIGANLHEISKNE